ncbi:OsmC family protein [Fusibacter bizertensis]
MALIEVKFPGGARVDAHMKGHVIATDQPTYAGGEDSASAPFDLFLASIATCAGFYALSFCEHKGISTEGLSLSMDTVKNPETKMIEKVNLNLVLPKDFPEKYTDAIKRSMDLCVVKKHLFNPPEFEINAH